MSSSPYGPPVVTPLPVRSIQKAGEFLQPEVASGDQTDHEARMKELGERLLEAQTIAMVSGSPGFKALREHIRNRAEALKNQAVAQSVKTVPDVDLKKLLYAAHELEEVLGWLDVTLQNYEDTVKAITDENAKG